MLDEDSPSRLARLLVGRAVDGSVDIPSRSHAVLQLVELVDSSQPWACDGEAQDECDEAADEAMASDEEEGDAHSRVRSHEACTLALLSSLPAASAASKPLTSKLMHALSSVLRHNPWRAAVHLVDSSGGGARSAWLARISAHLDPMLAAIEAVGEAAHPLPTLVRSVGKQRHAADGKSKDDCISVPPDLPQTPQEMAEAVRSARDAIEALRHDRPLYNAARLPDLQKTAVGGEVPASAGRKRVRAH